MSFFNSWTAYNDQFRKNASASSGGRANDSITSEFKLPNIGFDEGGIGYNQNDYLASGLGDSYVPDGSNMGGNYGLQDYKLGDTGHDWGTLQGWGQLLGGVGDIGNAYMAYKNYGLAKDQFKFSKAYANQNLQNQTTLVNSQLRSQNRARNRLGGGDKQTTQLNYKPIG